MEQRILFRGYSLPNSSRVIPLWNLNFGNCLVSTNFTYSLHPEHWIIQESVNVLHLITCHNSSACGALVIIIMFYKKSELNANSAVLDQTPRSDLCLHYLFMLNLWDARLVNSLVNSFFHAVARYDGNFSLPLYTSARELPVLLWKICIVSF